MYKFISIKFGPIQVLSGIVILKKYLNSVEIQVFAIFLNDNVLIYPRNWFEILEKRGKSLEFCFKKSVGTLGEL